ncbi:hypothetical protein [Olleya sp. HaHaR_3_96]|uniref:hypothetical protein n=1 Tax=Olleya sp. HaHaR_3_96 TaxID=2745560 RepID=UPI001C4F5AA5|nr:hypothetical protein [Olleya sp. HaHaR_3_96]QXP60643.1 hypothetical protein H0I26_03100 [Olleya sp. HaHaR_3_96]
MPGDSCQNSIGKTLFDGANSPAFTLNSPYVSYADVTDYLRGVKSLNVVYTIANINATEGFVFGSSARGWMLCTKRILSLLNT